MRDIWERPGDRIRPTDKCRWCHRPGAYAAGTGCRMLFPPALMCPTHARFTDLNLIARGRRAVIKCMHYGQGGVVLWANPSADTEEWVNYLVQFYWPGLGSELYCIPPHKGMCPHEIFDKLVTEMQAGARPNPNRVPPPYTVTAEPGKALED